MSDSTSDRKSSPVYTCMECGKTGYYEDLKTDPLVPFNCEVPLCSQCISTSSNTMYYSCPVCRVPFSNETAAKYKNEIMCISCKNRLVDADKEKTLTYLEQGLKFSEDKLKFNLIPPQIKLYLAETLTYGAKKYAPDNWKKVPVEKYYDAFHRHLNAFQLGETYDEESGLHHLKHALTNMMFITYLEINKE